MMNKLYDTKILIVEDEIIIADYIEELLLEENFKHITIANNKETALIKMTSFLPDIILMDINLKGENEGISLAKSKNNNATVVFITGQHDLVLMNEALKSNPAAYLTKPIKRLDLLATINLAIYKKQSQIFQFKDGYDIVNLNFSDIRYFVAEGNYVNIYTLTKRFTIRQSLMAVKDKLPTDRFKQTHRSYIVNKNKIERVTSNAVVINGLDIPLSRTYAKQFK